MTTKIAIIGIDGSGKTTLINKLEKRLILNGYAVKKCSYKQHNYTILEEYSSKFFITQEMRMYASFFDFLSTFSEAKDVDFILWDRFIFCILAYYRALKISSSETLSHLIQNFMPDYIYYLDIPVNSAIKRLKNRGPVKPLENAEFLSKVQKEYKKICKKYPIYILDALQDPQYLTDAIFSQIKRSM